MERIPSKGLIVRIELTDQPTERFWMLLRPPHPEICSTYQGWVEDLIVRTDSETLAHWHLRHLTYEEAARSGRLKIEGSRSLVKAFLACIRPSPFAGIPSRVRDADGQCRAALDEKRRLPPRKASAVGLFNSQKLTVEPHQENTERGTAARQAPHGEDDDGWLYDRMVGASDLNRPDRPSVEQ